MLLFPSKHSSEKKERTSSACEVAKDNTLSEKEIYKLAGREFNISSPKQVGEILYDVLKIVEKPQKTKTGQYATGEDVLEKLKGTHPVIDKILEYRELQKLK